MQRWTIFAPAIGAAVAGLVTFVLVSKFGFPDLTTTKSNPALWYAAMSFVYLAFGTTAGIAIGIATAFGMVCFQGTQRPDFSVPWGGLAVSCCLFETATLVFAICWLINSYQARVTPNAGSSDGQRAFDDMSYFVIVDVCFIFLPMMLFARGFAYAAAWSFYNQRRSNRPVEFSTSNQDGNVVFLRSFRTGRSRRKIVLGRNPIGAWFAPWDSAYFQRWIGETFDEILRPSVERYLGSFVAIADPKAHLPNTGAESTYARDDEWQHVVANMISSSRAVILLEGATNGLHWELNHLKAFANPRKVVVATLPRDFHRVKYTWTVFAGLLVQAGLREIMNPGPGAIIGFSAEWEPILILKDATDFEMIAKSIAQWVSRQDGTGGTVNSS